MTGKALEMTLWGIPFSPLACDLKCETAKMSFSFTDLTFCKPHGGAVKIWFKDSVGSSRGDTEIFAKWSFSSSGKKPCSVLLVVRINPSFLISFQKFLLLPIHHLHKNKFIKLIYPFDKELKNIRHVFFIFFYLPNITGVIAN